MGNKSTGDKLIALAIRHAEISAELKINQDQIIKDLEYCDQGEFIKPESDSGVDFSFLEASLPFEKKSCIQLAYESFGPMNHDLYDDHISYDEILANYGCRHCNSVRSLKRHVGKVKQERGRIHSAMTNIGKTLYHLKES